MIVQKQTTTDVEGYENVNRVVFVSG
jgi:hypothetical protein